ncbi:conserved hypothetical protein [Planctopirus limnophila DSM 3776]|uniref:YhcH/YjgK/YiaL family protein n=1 Tax=Planctopirus limnophila (strain ATCC 43296 / DSM 3776 / IFAM 1008 / Mu 290) TaxID=521674 RepID=D5SUI0_PLAL2|nr:YhcH/YjgK/YiaL family protein [Planctopirus limnophila]ADG67032.1 conserved hypothetical protein [Planctopirus limnophila DSM 3776]
MQTVIIDELANQHFYSHCHPAITRALQFLASPAAHELPTGKHRLDSDALIAIVEEYQTKQPTDAVWESHRKYVDVQYIVRGEEAFGLARTSDNLAIRTPYSDERDVVFYGPGTQRFVASAGMFLVFFPQDIHAPGLAVNEPSPVRKIVMKVRGDWGFNQD